MSISPMYPPEVLTRSPDEQLIYYSEEVVVIHPELTTTLDLLDSKANSTLDRRLILLVGGTGVGKTVAAKLLVKRRAARRVEEVRLRPELVPSIFIEAEPPDRGDFDFTTLYREGLAAMNAVLVERTMPVLERKTRDGTLVTLAIEGARKRIDGVGLKLRFKGELISREVELVAIDEAICLFKTGTSKSEKQRMLTLKDQSDKLKTFTNKTPASILLAGAFDFFDLATTTGQLGRRSLIVLMSPYPMTDVGLKGFGIALVGLIGHLPIAHDLRVEDSAAEIFLQSLGCVGIAKGILSAALLLSLRSGTLLTIGTVRLCYYPAVTLKVMSEEMEAGMKAVRTATSLSALASKAEAAPAEPSDPDRPPARPLKPGETKPSHRGDAANAW